jgi:molybdopterin synthase sulfur carrier subunit
LVTLLYFASVKEKLGIGRETVELPAAVFDVASLTASLRGRGGAWPEALGATSLKVAVNHSMVGMNAPIRDGDEIAFFPPVTGG